MVLSLKGLRQERTTLRSGNIGHQSPSDAVRFLRRMEISAMFPVSCACCVRAHRLWN